MAANPAVHTYLTEVRRHLHLDNRTVARVMTELSGHFHEKMADLISAGLARTEAEREAIRAFGEARQVARLMDRAYGRGTWVEALIGAQPHLIAAWLFATHLWRLPAAAALACAAFIAITLMGWKAGRPSWTYSWAGYALFPPLVFAYLERRAPLEALAALASGADLLPALIRFVAITALYGLTLVLLVFTAVRTCRRDWILASLILLPLSVLGIWVYSVERLAVSLPVPEALKQVGWDRPMAWMCVVLAVAAAVFVRMRSRFLKGAVVVLIGMVAGTAVVLRLYEDLRPGGALAVLMALFLVMVSPLVITALAGRAAEIPSQPKEVHAS